MHLTANAATQAIAHCANTTNTAHFQPSSRFTDAMAATHGVYKRQKARRLAAASGVIAASKISVLPKSTFNVATTLSLAIKPVISAVDTLQSPKPSGLKTGAIQPATTARILSLDLLPHSVWYQRSVRTR